MKATIQSSPTYSDIRFRAYTSSTLLIPVQLLEYFNSRVIFFGGRRNYFEHLIMTYGRRLAKFDLNPTASKWKKAYQAEGLELQIKNFKPDPRFWEEFRHLGFGYGLSMCHLFVVLLELEYKRWIEADSPEIFCEKPPHVGYSNILGVNSSKISPKEGLKALDNLLSYTRRTTLHRSIDFSKYKLDRICTIE